MTRPAKRTRRFPAWLDAYVRLAASATTANQLHAVHIKFENRMAPEEETMLYQYLTGKKMGSRSFGLMLRQGFLRLADRFSTSSNKSSLGFQRVRHRKQLLWAYSLRTHSALAGTACPTSLRRQWTRSGGSLYLSSRPVSTLIVGVSGGNQRMALRAPTFLRFMETYPAHVLLVTGKKGHSYEFGAPGFGDSPGEVAGFIRELQIKHHTPSVRVVSVSKGTEMAILLAGLLRADALMLASPVGISEDFFDHGAGKPGGGHSSEAIAWAAAFLAPTVVFSSDLEKDRKAAQQIRSGFHQARMVGLEDVPHAVFWPLAQKGILRTLFDQSLGKW